MSDMSEVLPTGFLTVPGVMAGASASLCSFHDSIITIVYFLSHVYIETWTVVQLKWPVEL